MFSNNVCISVTVRVRNVTIYYTRWMNWTQSYQCLPGRWWMYRNRWKHLESRLIFITTVNYVRALDGVYVFLNPLTPCKQRFGGYMNHPVCLSICNSTLKVKLIHSCNIYLFFNTARYFRRFPLDGLAMYIVNLNGLFIYLHGPRVEPHTIDAFDWLQLVEIINNMASKQAPLRFVWLQNRQIHRCSEHCVIKIVVNTFLLCMHSSFKSLIRTIGLVNYA